MYRKTTLLLTIATVAVFATAGCLPEGDEPYTGDGPEIQGNYQLEQVQVYEEDCSGRPQIADAEGVFKLERESSEQGDFVAWYDCASLGTCDLTHKRNMSFYEPRPETWQRVSLWAVEGVGECILRNETAVARLEGDTLSIDVRAYRKNDRSISAENCTQNKASSIASPTNCARREVTTARLVTQ